MQDPNLKYQSISVIVPAHNEEATIAETIIRLSRLQKELPDMEIIVVDDGSTDNTQQKVQSFSNVIYIRHAKNEGKGAALATGIKASSGEVIVVQDADLEYFPEKIPELVKPILAQEADVIYGTRVSKGIPEGMSSSHYVGNRLLSLATTMMYGVKLTDVMTGYKAFRRKVVNPCGLESKGFDVEVELTVLALCNGWRFKEIPLEYRYRQRGTSKIRFKDGFTCLRQLFLGRFEYSYLSFVENLTKK